MLNSEKVVYGEKLIDELEKVIDVLDVSRNTKQNILDTIKHVESVRMKVILWSLKHENKEVLPQIDRINHILLKLYGFCIDKR